MIDWYIILFIGTILLLYRLDKIAADVSLHSFFFLRKELGIKQGTVLLYMSVFTGFSLLIPLFILFAYGLSIGVSYYAIIFLLVFFLIIKYLTGFYRQNENERNILHFYENRFTKRGFKLFMPLFIVANLEGLLLQLAIANKIFQLYFTANSMVFIGLVLLFALIVAGLGGLETIYKTGYLILILCSCSLLFIPLFLYVKAGTHTIFQTYSFYEATKNFSVLQILITLISITVAYLGSFLMNAYFYQVLQSISPKYVKSTLQISLFCYLAVPIALLIYGVYIISLNQTSLYFTFGYAIFYYSGKILSLMVVIVWISSVLFSSIGSLFAITTLVFTYSARWRKNIQLNVKHIYLFAISLCCCIFLLQIILINYTIQLTMIYALFYISISFPVWSIARKQKKHSAWIIVFILLIWIVGGFFALVLKEIFIGFTVTVSGMIIHILGIKILNILKKYKIM